MTGAEPPGAGWSQVAGGQQGDARLEQLGIEPGFAQQMWLGACSLLHAQTSAGDRTALLGLGGVAGVWACGSNPRHASPLASVLGERLKLPIHLKGVCRNDLKPAVRVSFWGRLGCGRRDGCEQGEWSGRGKQARMSV